MDRMTAPLDEVPLINKKHPSGMLLFAPTSRE